MKKLFITFFALCASVLPASAVKVYINAGHGSWGSEDRNMATITHALGDTTGFYESNTNLWKALQMEAKLKSAGYTTVMSRRTNGESRALSAIKAEANNSGADYFISIHSNAGPEGTIDGSSSKFANYPVMLYRGTNGNPYVSNSDKMAKASVLRLYEIFWTTPANKNGTGADGGPEFTTYYSPSSPDILGDYSFYGYHLGVLPTGVPGFLAEGYFHTYSPARHRALNPDWCRQEGIRYARGVKDYFGTSGETVGYIMGYVRSKTEKYTHTYYIPYKSSNDIYKPINGAKVYLTDANGNVVKTNCYRYVKRELKNQDYYTTDNNYNGVFVYDDLKPGTYTLTVKASGYKTYTQSVVVTADKTVYPEIFLTPGSDPEPLKEAKLNPYAYKLSSELSADSTKITVKFYLAGLASNVKIIFNDGKKDYIARDYSDVKAGGYSSTIAIDTMPKGVPLTWRVDVKGPGLVAPYKSDREYYFLYPTSVDVDDNPQSPNFGRILCNEAHHAIKSKAAAALGASGYSYDNYKSYTLGAGLYEFDAQFEYVNAYNGNHSFTTNRLDVTTQTAMAPHRIRIADDGRIFVTSFNGGSEWSGKIMWIIKPESMNTWVPAFWYDKVAENSELQMSDGSYVAAPNVGMDVQGSGENLKVLMLSATNECYDSNVAAYRCYEYNWGTKAAWNTAVQKKWFDGNIANACNGVFKVINHYGAQVQFDNHGGIWMCQYQTVATDTYPSLVYYDKNGVYRFHETMNCRAGGGFRFNKDFTRVIISGGNGVIGEATVYTVTNDENGYPTRLVKEFTIPMDLGLGMCDFAWDYADNIYAVSNSKEKIAVYSLPYSSKRVLSTPAADKYSFTLNGTYEPSPEPEPKPEGVTANGMNPFAYALSSVLNADSTSLTVNYTLNAAATSVNIVVSSEDSIVATIPSEGIAKGEHSLVISTADLPKNAVITWRVDVTGAGFTNVTCVDNSAKFFCPTSIDIDNNPNNENFGTIFCVEGRSDAMNNVNYGNYISYVDGAGLYVLNADGTPRRIPNQAKVRYGYNGGSNRVNRTTQYFNGTSYGGYSPYRVRVSDDGRIFISSLTPDGQILWETNPLVFSRPNAEDWASTTGWSRVMSDINDNTYMATEKRNCSHTYCGIYSIYTEDSKKFLAGPNIGFDVQGAGDSLKLLMLSGCMEAIVNSTSHHFYCSEYDLGTAKQWTTVPSREIFRGHVVNYAGTQVQYDKDGNVWMCQHRNTTDAATLIKFNADGSIAYQEDPKQPYHRCGAIRFNNDFTKVAIASKGSGEGGAVTIYPILEDGMPDWANGQEIDTKAITHYSIMDMAWDYANNLYLAADVANGTAGQCIAVYAMPHESDQVISTPVADNYAFMLNGPITYELTLTINDTDMGTVEGAGTYYEGDTATLVATPNEGYEFVCWIIEGDTLTANPLELTIVADVAVEAVFAAIPVPQYTISVVINDSTMGVVEGAGVYESGTTATLTATAHSGYAFVNWTIGEEVITSNPLVLVVENDVTLLATFKSTVTTNIESADSNTYSVSKILHNGVIYIIRNDEIYTTIGSQVSSQINIR